MSSSETISPTAHYTGYVWARNGLSRPEFETIEGRVLFEALRPAMTVDAVRGLAIITEGLLGYLPTAAVLEVWARFAGVLSAFSTGCYISDIHMGALQDAAIRVFRVLLSVFVQGRVHLHFDSPEQVVSALEDSGFASARVRMAADLAAGSDPASRVAHILEAWTQ